MESDGEITRKLILDVRRVEDEIFVVATELDYLEAAISRNEISVPKVNYVDELLAKLKHDAQAIMVINKSESLNLFENYPTLHAFIQRFLIRAGKEIIRGRKIVDSERAKIHKIISGRMGELESVESNDGITRTVWKSNISTSNSRSKPFYAEVTCSGCGGGLSANNQCLQRCDPMSKSW